MSVRFNPKEHVKRLNANDPADFTYNFAAQVFIKTSIGNYIGPDMANMDQKEAVIFLLPFDGTYKAWIGASWGRCKGCHLIGDYYKDKSVQILETQEELDHFHMGMREYAIWLQNNIKKSEDPDQVDRWLSRLQAVDALSRRANEGQ